MQVAELDRSRVVRIRGDSLRLVCPGFTSPGPGPGPALGRLARKPKKPREFLKIAYRVTREHDRRIGKIAFAFWRLG